MKTALVMMTMAAVLLAGVVISQAGELKRQAPQGEPGRVGAYTMDLEVIGAAFPTLPESYVSIRLKTVLWRGTGPQNESYSVGNQRVTIPLEDARRLRDALDEWLSDPSVTTTLLQKAY